MLPTAHISAGVSTQQCLSWSPDGELAIAAGEEVYLLLPRHNDIHPWTHVRIPVGSFTTAEWPWQEQASFKDMSIGEEQAKVTVIALAWSPSGLVKHRRSVLAVLTSNLLLSLWTYDTDPANPESWKRVLIVNDALVPFNVGTPQVKSRQSQRVRSMAWTPTCERHIDRETPFSARKWGIFLIAITDDNSGIHFINILSPSLCALRYWDVQHVFHKQLSIDEIPIQRPSLLSVVMKEKRFIDEIFFGDWTAVGEIPVIYRSRGIRYQELLSLSLGPPLIASLRLTDILWRSSDNSFARTPQIAIPSSPFHVTPPFRGQVHKQKEKYGIESNQGEDVTVKTWGIASFRHLQAACITLHPSKSFEYTAPSEDSATILFDNGTVIDSPDDKFPWQNPPEVDEAKARQKILDTILNRTVLESLSLSKLDVKIVYGASCAIILTIESPQQQHVHAIEEIYDILKLKMGVDLQSERALLMSLPYSGQLSKQEFARLVNETTMVRQQTVSSSGSRSLPLIDECPICTELDEPQAIYFQNLMEGYCPHMHPFCRPKSLCLKGI